MLIAAWLTVFLLGFKHTADNTFDAPIPDRCATFEKMHDADLGNLEFCKAWRIEHLVVRKALASANK